MNHVFHFKTSDWTFLQSRERSTVRFLLCNPAVVVLYKPPCAHMLSACTNILIFNKTNDFIFRLISFLCVRSCGTKGLTKDFSSLFYLKYHLLLLNNLLELKSKPLDVLPAVSNLKLVADLGGL